MRALAPIVGASDVPFRHCPCSPNLPAIIGCVSQENVDLDVKFDFTNLPDGGVLVGRDGVFEGMRRWVSSWESYEMELDDFIDAGDRVVVLFRERGKGRGSGVETVSHPGAVWTVEGGSVVRMQPFSSRADAFAAAGIPAPE
jgi:ketosteroid isomerase-like protein